MSPPEVYLNVRAQEPIAPNQVSLLQAFEREMKQSLKLVQVQEIRAKNTSYLLFVPERVERVVSPTPAHHSIIPSSAIGNQTIKVTPGPPTQSTGS